MTGEKTSIDLDDAPALAALLQKLRERHHGAVNSALLYGSCLRSGDIFDGLVDLYLICDSYRSAYASRGLALSNWVLPPNVFYADVEHEGKKLRCKYSVISTADFCSGCSPRWFESYIWGRFAQPTRMVYWRDEASRYAVEQCIRKASRTFLQRVLPCLPASGPVSDLWRDALALSAAAEPQSWPRHRAGISKP